MTCGMIHVSCKRQICFTCPEQPKIWQPLNKTLACHLPIICEQSGFYYWDPFSPSDNLEATEGIMLCGNDRLPVMHSQGGWSYKHVKIEPHSTLHTGAHAAGAAQVSCAVSWGTCWAGGMWWESRNTGVLSCTWSQVMFSKHWHSLRSDGTPFVLCQTKFVSWEIIGFFMAFLDFS